MGILDLAHTAFLHSSLLRFNEAEEVGRTLLAWADETKPDNRAIALQVFSVLMIRKSCYSEAVEMARKATRLFPGAGNVGSAGDAEYLRSFGHFYLEQWDEDAESVLTFIADAPDRSDSIDRLSLPAGDPML